MDTIFIFGHKKPDTDSVTSAIALSYLKNQIGFKTEPRVLGNINNETNFVLNYFKINKPKYLNDVKLQIKDINYTKNCFLHEKDSIFDSYNYMADKGISTLPIVNDKGSFIGAVSLKDITKQLLSDKNNCLHTSYNNISFATKAEELLKFDEEISGNVIFPSYGSTTFRDTVVLDRNNIVVVGNRHSIIEYAIESSVLLLILTNNVRIKPEHFELAKKNKVNIIRTSYDAFSTANIITLSNYVKDSAKLNNIIVVNENDSVSEFMVVANKKKYSNYPIVNNKNICLGVLRISEIEEKKPKMVILVDHNEKEQSAVGLDESNILEIVDHHKIGNIGTILPINFRNMPVGSTNTIIYMLYVENGVIIPKNIAGLMLSGILSDTLLFRSPTTTEIDKKVAYELSSIADLNLETYGMEMLKEGSSFEGKTKSEILFTDFKNFNINEQKVGIGQVSTLNIAEIINQKEEYIHLLNDLAKNEEYIATALFVTDIINNGSYIIYNENSAKLFEDAFALEKIKQATFFPGIISRKKQIVPKVISAIEKVS